MNNQERVELVAKTIAWVIQADKAVKSVGGCGVEIILEGVSDDLLYSMVSNGLVIAKREIHE
jgi:hypothetical protein